MMDQIRRWHTYADVDSLRRDVVKKITDLARECIEHSGAFHVVLAGGSTPRAIYQDLRTIDTDWSGWHIYFGDERCLGADDPERNDTMAKQSWLDHIAIPETQIHPVPAELGSEAGAHAYAEMLAGIDMFDLVLLGLGEDGHTASLFSDHSIGDDPACSVLAVHAAPKPPAERISMSAARLSQARQVWFVVTGEGKRQALKQWQQEIDIPALAIHPQVGVDIYTDIDDKLFDG